VYKRLLQGCMRDVQRRALNWNGWSRD